MTSTIARLTTLIAFIPLLAFPTRAPAQDEPAEQDTERVSVAVIFDKPVYLDIISPHPSIIAQQRKKFTDEKEFQQWLEGSRERILREHLFKLLANAYMQENAISVSDVEVDEFLAKEQQVYAEVLLQNERRVAQLKVQADELTAKGQTVPQIIDRDIKILEKRILRMKRQNIDNLMVGESQRRLHADAQRQRASAALRSWKFNRLIHEQYGGRVVPRKLSYEPYEAYARWLQVQEQTGAFSILDDQLRKQVLSRYDTVPEGAIDPFPGMWDSLRWTGSGMP